MQTLYFRPVISIFFFFFYSSPIISAAANWMSTILPHMVWPYTANLECISEMCCTRLAENTKCKKIAISAPSNNFVGPCLKLLNSNTSSICPHSMVNFGVLTAEICWRVWDIPANFNEFRVLAALLHGSLVVGVSQTLRRWTECATYIRQGGHHVGHWPTF